MDTNKVLTSLLAALLWSLAGVAWLAWWLRSSLLGWILVTALFVGLAGVLLILRQLRNREPAMMDRRVRGGRLALAAIILPLAYLSMGLFAVNAFGLWPTWVPLRITTWMLLGSGIIQIVVLLALSLPALAKASPPRGN